MLFTSCDFFLGVIHDGKVVAQAGSHKLYSTELENFIPSGLSAEDSTRLAMQYINSWAADQLYLDIAEKELSKGELDVDRELEEYRRSLLKYRYEQAYVNQRLDTAVTRSQIEDYFEAHKDQFILRVPILKLRMMSFTKDSPSYSEFRKKISSKKPSDLSEADSLAYSASLRYTDFGGSWVDAVTVAREFGIDYGQMLAKMNQSYIIFESGDVSDIKAAYVREMRRTGVAPFDFCSDRIREYILSGRKHDLLIALEQSLLKGASDDGQFVIY